MNPKLVIAGLLAGMVIELSCRNSPTETNAPPLPEFPNSIGSTWTYAHYDSLAKIGDTVVVTIVGKTTLDSGEAATVWEYSSPGKTDTAFVTGSQDTVRFISSGRVYKILFPLQVGMQWGEAYINDTSRVTGYGSVTVIAGTFPNAYKIVETWGGFNDYGSIARWFVPTVGIVRIYHKGWSFGEANETFDLIRYRVIE